MSHEELKQQISRIVSDSDAVAGRLMATQDTMTKLNRVIAAHVKGSRTGQDAVAAMQLAIAGMGDAAASMQVLKRTCNDYISYLGR